MQQEDITALFDRQAACYDEQWSKLAPINATLHLLTRAVLAGLPSNARILCVGAGTGNEILSLAKAFPQWRFTAVEPSAGMIEVLCRRTEEHGISPRCQVHLGLLESLPPSEPFDAATSFLVSQFILEPETRTQFFRAIADRLAPGGMLVTSDLSGRMDTTEGQSLLDVWLRVMRGGDIPPEGAERMRQAYGRDVAVIPAENIGTIVRAGGFESPIQYFQAGLIHAWYARRL